MSAVDIKYRLSVTKYDIIEFVYNHLHKYGWKTTFNYLVYKPRKFYDKPLILPEGSCQEFNKYINYCYLLSKNYTEKDEAARYAKTNGTGIYFSVVLYWLLVSYGVVNQKKLKFCQGCFSYKMREDVCTHPRYRAGMHAWLSYHDSVLDTTIWQQREFFDFETSGLKTPVIKGEIPTNLELLGFEEHKSLAKEYARRFARDSGMTFFEWLGFHRQQADLLNRADYVGTTIVKGR